jgi:hypothetical protein
MGAHLSSLDGFRMAGDNAFATSLVEATRKPRWSSRPDFGKGTVVNVPRGRETLEALEHLFRVAVNESGDNLMTQMLAEHQQCYVHAITVQVVAGQAQPLSVAMRAYLVGALAAECDMRKDRWPVMPRQVFIGLILQLASAALTRDSGSESESDGERERESESDGDGDDAHGAVAVLRLDKQQPTLFVFDSNGAGGPSAQRPMYDVVTLHQVLASELATALDLATGVGIDVKAAKGCPAPQRQCGDYFCHAWALRYALHMITDDGGRGGRPRAEIPLRPGESRCSLITSFVVFALQQALARNLHETWTDTHARLLDAFAAVERWSPGDGAALRAKIRQCFGGGLTDAERPAAQSQTPLRQWVAGQRAFHAWLCAWKPAVLRHAEGRPVLLRELAQQTNDGRNGDLWVSPLQASVFGLCINWDCRGAAVGGACLWTPPADLFDATMDNLRRFAETGMWPLSPAV